MCWKVEYFLELQSGTILRDPAKDLRTESNNSMAWFDTFSK